MFIADKFAQVFTDAGRPDIPVTLVPDVGHIMLTLAPAARSAAVAAVERLNAGTNTARQSISSHATSAFLLPEKPTNN